MDYTSKGVLQKVGQHTEVAFDFASKVIYTTNVEEGTTYDGNVACRLDGEGGIYNNQDNANHACINKGDLFFMFDPVNRDMNPPHLNLHLALYLWVLLIYKLFLKMVLAILSYPKFF